MNKITFLKRFAFIFLLATATGPLLAECYANVCKGEYTCDCNPLNCGAWSLQFDVGIAPLQWLKRADMALVNCNPIVVLPGQPTGPVFEIGDLPHFNNLFHTPWALGGQLSYAITDNVNIFFELGFMQARHKGDGQNTDVPTTASSITTPIVQNPNFLLKLEKYRFVNAYFGTRYYFDRSCDRYSLFFGEKIGLVHHYRTTFESLSVATVISQYSNRTFFKRNTVVSGGVHIGFDICLCSNWSLVLTGEFVAEGGPRSIDSLTIQPSDATASNLGGLGVGTSNLLMGSVNAEFYWPITLGLKYTF